MAFYWYAVRSKPRKEEIVWRQILSDGFETYLPRMRVNPVNPRARRLIPYFPGYLFVHADLDAVGLSIFQWMPHTIGIVTFGGEPAIVPENLVHSIRKRVDEINIAGGENVDGIKQGDEIIIQAGPFQGYEAIFDARLPGTVRVRVLLQLLGSQRQVPVEMDLNQIHVKK